MAVKYLDETGLAYLWAKIKAYVDSTPLSFYPVGSVYISTNSTSPATIFGGTWVQIKGRFLLGTGAPDDNTNSNWGTDLTYDGTNKFNETVKSTGGEARHQLAESEMPSHVGHLPVNSGSHTGYGNADGLYLAQGTMASYGSTPRGWDNNGSEMTPAGVNRGGGLSHNNMPPYYTVYMWERTA